MHGSGLRHGRRGVRSFMGRAKGRWKSGKLEEKTGLEGEVYENVTGVVHGRWARYNGDLAGVETHRSVNISAISPGIDWAYRNEESWTRNITGKEGKLMLRIDEKNTAHIDPPDEEATPSRDDLWSGGLVRNVAATMTVQDESSSGDGWEMRIHGVHWPRQGVLLMTTTSEKFAGVFGLPHLTMRKEYFATSQKLLNRTLEQTIEEMENSVLIDPSNPWTSRPEAQADATMPTPHCEYVVYVQLYPVDLELEFNHNPADSAKMIHQIEQELRFPNGAPLPITPDLHMSTVIFSPDCGFILESKGPPDTSPKIGNHLVGIKQEVFIQNIHNWLLVLAVIIFSQIMLLKIQSKEASTPSTVGRVSLYTVSMMLMTDALLFSSLSLLSATVPNIFPSALLASFASLMSVALGVRFIGAVYNVQEPERRAALAAAQAANSAARTALTPRPAASAPIITAAGADAPLLPMSAPPPPVPSPPVIIPSDQDIDAEIAENVQAASAVPIPARAPLLPTTNPVTTQATPRPASFGAMYVQFVITITLIMFISLSATSWPVSIRTAYVHIMSFIYLSFWIPQIRRNIVRNCRKALLWKFVVGQSVLRLLPFAYFYLKEDNILFAESDWTAFTVLAGWVWIQIWILIAQEILGPRWGLPKDWTEEAWDYHPILKVGDAEGGGLPIGLVQTPVSPTHESTPSNTSENVGDISKKSDDGKRTGECVICQQILEVPVVASGSDIAGSASSGGVVGLLARRQYMVTPCNHIFHSKCLEDWMRYKLQCPHCRENLPPL